MERSRKPQDSASRAHQPDRLRRIFGIDFSGAAKGGDKIWIARGRDDGGRFRIDACRRGRSLPGSGRERARCLAALRRFIASQEEGILGLDFPFGLPSVLVQDRTWEEFIEAFPCRYGTPEAFREACRKAAGGKELKRSSDGVSKPPFSAYNLRLFRQTYYGIAEVLQPLVRDHLVCVLPMQDAEPGKPWVLEICPASTLKTKNLYFSYKGRRPELARARLRILQEIQKRGDVCRIAPSISEVAMTDPEGDALDSLIAALSTFEVVREGRLFDPLFSASSMIEGYLYV